MWWKLRKNRQRHSSRSFTGADSYTFDEFVFSASNRSVQQTALAVADAPNRTCNPLFISGSVGSGKTHLLFAIQHRVETKHPAMQVRYVSSERLMIEYADRFFAKKWDSFTSDWRKLDVLLIDGTHFLESPRMHDGIVYILEELENEGVQIVISSDRTPTELEHHLRYRFQRGRIESIEEPDFEARLLILRRKRALLGGRTDFGPTSRIEIPDSVLELIAERIRHNMRELESVLVHLTGYSELTDAPVTIDSTRRALGWSHLPDEGADTPRRELERVRGPLYAVRAWGLRRDARTAELASLGVRYVWREPHIEALCTRNGECISTEHKYKPGAWHGRPPAEHGACGIYAYKTWRDYLAADAHGDVVGIVELHGRVCAHQYGYRAAAATIVALASSISEVLQPEDVALLRAGYSGVPIASHGTDPGAFLREALPAEWARHIFHSRAA